MSIALSAEPRKSLYGYSYESLRALIGSWGEKPVHADAILKALYHRRVETIAEIPGLPRSLQEILEQETELSLPVILRTQIALDSTKKYLFGLQDGQCVEGVLLRYAHGNTLCISTQKGCKMGCTFCASSSLPFGGNLDAAEIVGQLLAVEEQEKIRVRNLVYMGIGEPLDNAEAVKESLYIFSDPRAVGVGARHISVSTCGVVPGILRMAEEKWPCRLAVSLHYVDDAKRSTNMPINRRYPVPELLAACREYTEVAGHVVFFEYAIVPGENDSIEDATALVEAVKEIPCRINLIALNPLDANVQQADPARAEAFQEVLRNAGIITTKRPALGQEIDGACGQLRGSAIAENQA